MIVQTIANPSVSLGLPEEVNDRVAHHLSRVVEGSDQVLIHPGFENVSDEDVADVIEGIFSRVHMTGTLLSIESSNQSKIGPRSIAKSWEDRKGDVENYFDNKFVRSDLEFDDAYKGSIDIARFAFGTEAIHRCKPVSIDTARSALISSSSSGLPYMVKKGDLKHLSNQEFYMLEGRYPAMLYSRTAEQRKTRTVWGYPVGDTVAENRFSIPLLFQEKMNPWRCALAGPEVTDLRISQLMRVAAYTDLELVGVDFSAYDASITPDLIMRAFAVVAHLFQPSYKYEIADLADRMITIPLLTPDGLWIGEHGVPSGSSFTNSIDSIVQLIIAYDELKRVRSQDPLCAIQGDDGLYLTNNGDKLYETFNNAGLSINADKSMRSFTEASYLQRYYHPDYTDIYSNDGELGGVYSLFRAWGRIKYLEKFTVLPEGIDGDDFFSIRTIIILENCKHHPGFEMFVKYVQGLDKNSLWFESGSLTAYSSIVESRERAKGNARVDSHEKGLMTFETVKLLRG